MADRPSIWAARPEEAQELTSLAFRSKAHWATRRSLCKIVGAS